MGAFAGNPGAEPRVKHPLGPALAEPARTSIAGYLSLLTAGAEIRSFYRFPR
jgi:hypothetical protein